jgi:hypothetical protein
MSQGYMVSGVVVYEASDTSRETARLGCFIYLLIPLSLVYIHLCSLRKMPHWRSFGGGIIPRRFSKIQHSTP